MARAPERTGGMTPSEARSWNRLGLAILGLVYVSAALFVCLLIVSAVR